MSWGLLAVEIILTVAAVAAALLPAASQRQIRLNNGVALLGIILATGVALALPSDNSFWWGFLTLDGMARFFRVLILVASGLVVLLSREFLLRRDLPVPEFHALLLLSTLGMELAASTTNLLLLYLGLEIMAISGYALAGFLRNDPKSGEGALKYFLMGSVATSILLLGIVLIYGQTGSLDLSAISRQISQPDMGLVAGTVMILAGLGFKVAAVPFHMWAPDTYEGSPTMVTAFFSVGPKLAGFAAMLRIMAVGLPGMVGVWQPMAAVMAVLTMTLGNLGALSQTNVKRMMGYSSIAQAGYVLAGLAVGTERSFGAMLFYLAAYVCMNLGAFAVITLVGAEEEREEQEAFDGLSRRHPFYAVALVLFFLSLVGIPPTAGFLGKVYLYGSAVEQGYIWLAVVMVVNTVLSVPYYYEIIRRMYFLPGQTQISTVRPWTTTAAVAVAALGTLGLGLMANPLLEVAIRLGLKI